MPPTYSRRMGRVAWFTCVICGMARGGRGRVRQQPARGTLLRCCRLAGLQGGQAAGCWLNELRCAALRRECS